MAKGMPPNQALRQVVVWPFAVRPNWPKTSAEPRNIAEFLHKKQHIRQAPECFLRNLRASFEREATPKPPEPQRHTPETRARRVPPSRSVRLDSAWCHRDCFPWLACQALSIAQPRASGRIRGLSKDGPCFGLERGTEGRCYIDGLERWLCARSCCLISCDGGRERERLRKQEFALTVANFFSVFALESPWPPASKAEIRRQPSRTSIRLQAGRRAAL
eukprot:scaffold114_cov361-Pinguiococcus_pyrenoidosus.AAC.38